MSNLILLLAPLTGQPLSKAEVWGDTIGEGPSEPTATSAAGAQGNFTIAGLNHSRYFLGGSRNGYLETCYGARRPGLGGKIAIALDPGQQVKDVALKLFPFSVVARTVHGSEGEPLSGVSVAKWAVRFGPGGRTFYEAATKDADDLGQFRIPDLEPGKYHVHAELQGLGSLVNVFYPGVPDPDAASTVEVGLGSRVTGLDIAIPRPRVIRVTVRIAAPEGFRPGCWLSSGTLHASARPAQGADTIRYSALRRLSVALAAGQYSAEFRGLPPGMYVRSMRSGSADVLHAGLEPHEARLLVRPGLPAPA
jgi:hypothetical protein